MVKTGSKRGPRQHKVVKMASNTPKWPFPGQICALFSSYTAAAGLKWVKMGQNGVWMTGQNGLKMGPQGSKCGQQRVNLCQNALNWVPNSLKWHLHELKWVQLRSRGVPRGPKGSKSQNGLKYPKMAFFRPNLPKYSLGRLKDVWNWV